MKQALLLLFVCAFAVADEYEYEYGLDEEFDESKKIGKKGGDISGFRMAEEGSHEGKGDKKKGTDMSGFRVAEVAEECPVTMYQIVSAKYPQLCVDASSKRLSLKRCGKETAHAHHLFSIHKAGDSFLLKNKEQCLSSSSLTTGPCESNKVDISRKGSFHMIHMNNGKCFNIKNRRSSNMIKCMPKNKAQHFRFVPIFDHVAPVAVEDKQSGFRVAVDKQSGFRVSSGSSDNGKKGKKGEGGDISDDTSVDSAPAPNSGSDSVVTVTTYLDDQCLTTPSWKDSTFTMDTNAACNTLPDSSTNNLVCHEDYITYTNYPNTDDCTAEPPRENTLQVGVCQYFPGPVPTWKKVHEPYNCRTN